MSRIGYCDWLKRKPSAREKGNQAALVQIREIHKKSKGRYGSPKIAQELKRKGLHISGPRVARIMRAANIRNIVHKRFKVRTIDSNHNYPIAKNLLDRDFSPERIGKAWVSYISYIKTLEGWLYLTTAIDLRGHKVVGWALMPESCVTYHL